MNVYLVNDNMVIAAEHVSDAFNTALRLLSNRKYSIPKDLEEGQSSTASLTFKRLTAQEIEERDVQCCDRKDGRCEWCKESEEPVFVSYQDVLEKKSEFPCVIGSISYGE